MMERPLIMNIILRIPIALDRTSQQAVKMQPFEVK
jgi:hypothetical protein